MVVSTDLGWLNTAFDTLTGLFDWVGMKTNFKKTVGVVCHPCRAFGVQADEAYTRRMTGEGSSYKERQWERINFPEWGKYLARVSLTSHRQTQHGVAKGGSGQEGDGEVGGDNPRTFRMTFLAKAGPRP